MRLLRREGEGVEGERGRWEGMGWGGGVGMRTGTGIWAGRT